SAFGVARADFIECPSVTLDSRFTQFGRSHISGNIFHADGQCPLIGIIVISDLLDDASSGSQGARGFCFRLLLQIRSSLAQVTRPVIFFHGGQRSSASIRTLCLTDRSWYGHPPILCPVIGLS